MSSNPIVVMIDEEIDRLRKVRAIFASLLSGTHAPKAKPAVRPSQAVARTLAIPQDPPKEPVFEAVGETTSEAVSEPVADQPIVPVLVRVPSHEPRRRRPREPKPVEQPLALRGVIPTSPVVVRSAVPKSIERLPEPPVAIEPGSFAALVRTAERELQTIA